MTAHPGLPVPGYRPKSEAAVAKVSRSKELEERVLRFLDELKLDLNVEPRWLQAGRTDIEKGFMAVNRAVFQPGRVALPEDAA